MTHTRKARAALWTALFVVACGGDAGSKEPGGDGDAGATGNTQDGSDSADGSDAGGQEPGDGAQGGDGADADGSSGDGTFRATVVELPAGTTSAFALALNDEDDVVLATSSGVTILDGIYVWKDGASTALPLAPGNTLSVTGLSARACIDNQGRVGFNAVKMGRQQAAYFDGTETVEIDFGAADPGSMLIVDCNDEGFVLAGTITGTEARAWKNGTAELVEQGTMTFGNAARAINGSGAVSFQYGYNEDGTFVPYPESASFFGVAGMTSDGRVAGVRFDAAAGTMDLALWKMGDAEATVLDKPAGYTGALVAVDLNEAGTLLVRGEQGDQAWVHEGGVYTQVSVPGYTLERVVGLNERGTVLAAAKADGSDQSVTLLLSR